jgi:hypothetical protein
MPKRSLENRGKSINYVTTGGAGYVPDASKYDIVNGVKTAGKKVLNKVRQVLYDRVDPYSYDIGQAVSQLISKGRETKKNDVYDALWARYLNRSNADVGYNVDDYLQPATYKPNKGTPVGQLYRLTPKSWDGNEDLNPLGDIQLYEMLKSGKTSDLGDGVGGTKTGLGTYTRSLGQDEKGKYMSYYDEWDISPIGNKQGKNGKDQTFGIGTPFSVYDRRYYTDEEAAHIVSEYDKFYQSVKDAAKNQSIKHEIYSPKPYRVKKSSGGSIHIAPSKRGTFTAAATKHGMGVQEFASRVLRNKDNYSPAMVKKANFARNASKWNH